MYKSQEIPQKSTRRRQCFIFRHFLLLDALLDRDVLPDEPRYLVRLIRLDPGDPLLHQIAALHVQKEQPIFGLHFPRRYHLFIRVVINSFLKSKRQSNPLSIELINHYVSDNVQKVHSIPVERHNVLATVHHIATVSIGVPDHREEARPEQQPLFQDFCKKIKHLVPLFDARWR